MPEQTIKQHDVAFGRQHSETLPASTFMRDYHGATTTMVFPRRVVLLLDSQKRIEFLPGPQEVPTEVAEHWYLKAHNVKPYVPGVPAAPEVPQVVTEHHVAFLQRRGYNIEAIEDAQSVVERMSTRERAAFFADAAEWVQPPAQEGTEEEVDEEEDEDEDDDDDGPVTYAQGREVVADNSQPAPALVQKKAKKKRS